jgi:dTDP-4-dehydrorhamnose 3,5-epimerase
MKIIRAEIPDVLILEPKVYADERGFFFESYNKRAFLETTGVRADFVQDNHSRSTRNVLRGLHYQVKQTQGKLVRVVAGEVFDVAVDLRRGSRHFGRWVSFMLSSDTKRIAWIPPGFAHGFLVMSESVELLYKTTEYYAPEHDRTLAWNDADVGIQWPLAGEPLLSDKDRRGTPLKAAETFG